MKIYTLWKHDGDDTAMPWLLDSVDEYTIEENNGFPSDYAVRRDQPGVRELVLNVSEAAVTKLFESPEATATAVKE